MPWWLLLIGQDWVLYLSLSQSPTEGWSYDWLGPVSLDPLRLGGWMGTSTSRGDGRRGLPQFTLSSQDWILRFQLTLWRFPEVLGISSKSLEWAHNFKWSSTWKEPPGTFGPVSFWPAGVGGFKLCRAELSHFFPKTVTASEAQGPCSAFYNTDGDAGLGVGWGEGAYGHNMKRLESVPSTPHSVFFFKFIIIF